MYSNDVKYPERMDESKDFVGWVGLAPLGRTDRFYQPSKSFPWSDLFTASPLISQSHLSGHTTIKKKLVRFMRATRPLYGLVASQVPRVRASIRRLPPKSFAGIKPIMDFSTDTATKVRRSGGHQLDESG